MASWYQLIKKFQRQPATRRVLLIEAALYLVLARLALRELSFHRIAGFLNRPLQCPEVTGIARKQIRNEVTWAIKQMTMRLPGETVCFPRAIAVQAMLRRRGVSVTLYYGAATLPERGLAAHVWVQDDTEGVVDYDAARRYLVLARYPETGKEVNRLVAVEPLG